MVTAIVGGNWGDEGKGKLSTVLAADEILVICDGEIAERGTHSELVGKGGVYTQLYETQFSRAAEQPASDLGYSEGESDA